VNELPFPPIEFMRIVGPTDPSLFDNASRAPIFGNLDEQAYSSVFDFGCGCGRIARQLIQQRPRPRRYVGIDRHREMVGWCQNNLAPHAPGFRFVHHDVLHEIWNPGGTPGHLPLPLRNEEVTLFIAWSVFTHLLEPDAEFYLQELGRALSPGGKAVTTWFFFDKGDFPMMQEFQNALYINPTDPTNAVIFDRAWFLTQVNRAGLVPTSITPPDLKGFQWTVELERQAEGKVAQEFPEDLAPRGLARPPIS
jgi:SAM-dependent methyltransferase